MRGALRVVKAALKARGEIAAASEKLISPKLKTILYECADFAPRSNYGRYGGERGARRGEKPCPRVRDRHRRRSYTIYFIRAKFISLPDRHYSLLDAVIGRANWSARNWYNFLTCGAGSGRAVIATLRGVITGTRAARRIGGRFCVTCVLGLVCSARPFRALSPLNMGARRRFAF